MEDAGTTGDAGADADTDGVESGTREASMPSGLAPPPVPPPPPAAPEVAPAWKLTPAVMSLAQRLSQSYNSICRVDELLYIGNATVAGDRSILNAHGIQAIVNVTPMVPNKFEGSLAYHRVAVDDVPTADLASHFDSAYEFIAASHRDGKPVFVHCQAGISRSATICIMYLMRSKSLSLADAHDQVKSARHLIRPNNGFWKQLIAYEEGRDGVATVELQQTARGTRMALLRPESANDTATGPPSIVVVQSAEAGVNALLSAPDAMAAATLLPLTEAALASLSDLVL